jgi:hypothetical protein
MIRLLPCARLARAQIERKAGEGKVVASMRIPYIPYWIFQLSRNLALRHNVVCLLYLPVKIASSPFQPTGFFSFRHAYRDIEHSTLSFRRPYGKNPGGAA